MKQSISVVLIVALAFVMTTQAQKCRNNEDCHSVCIHDPDHSVCDVPSGECHCHEYGHISCTDNEICKVKCNNQAACCNNDHHCHCNEPCTSG
ncbi:prestalk protein-like [Biomphalaria glabrata]|uniref:Prestalk protein-like n=1 Tax=Biomphalaria glabrata TaxID=6526 RepID=A0A9W3B7L7_BIOGL|nr:prestalk protein-like [Biomphalaria glabrata]